jgi:hypothetical protein
MIDSNTAMTKDELLTQIQQGWDRFQTYLTTLSDDQLTQLTDAGGWTIKDHVIHLAIWEDGASAMLQQKSRRERMDIEEAVWSRWNFDEINALIQRRYRELPLDQVLQTFHDVHEHLLALINAMSEEDVRRPVSHYDLQFGSAEPVALQLIMDTCGHYQEHTPWIMAIANQNDRESE